jgi:dTDP-4-dehydrorhamnose reductase
MTEIKTILVIGSTGQLGQSLKKIAINYPEFDFNFADRGQLDLSKPDSITTFFHSHHYDVILNCAAYTAVDKAEAEPELAEQINHLAVKQLAHIAKEQESTLIHISTDYVFNGQSYRPYIETDNVDPENVYGRTKLAGEQAVCSILDVNGFIIRTSWVYSEFGNNFVKTMLRLGHEIDSLNVIFDQVGTPTYAGDLAQAIMTIVKSTNKIKENHRTEIYHYSNEGVCSWYDFAKSIFEITNEACGVSPIETKDYPTPAKRPHYSLLNKSKIKQAYALDIPYWHDSLRQCLQILVQQEK